MAVAAGIMVPHPPLIVPEVGRGQETVIKDTVNAFHEAARAAADLGPDTIVVLSPHSVMYADYFHISPGERAKGNFGHYQAPQVSVEAEYDQEMTEALCRLADESAFPMGVMGERSRELDHGVMIPLYFINQYYRDYKLVRIGLSGLPFTDHYKAGQLIARAADQLGRRVMIVASGDLSHRLKEDGPYGYSPQGPLYDERIMEVMGRGEFDKLFTFSEGFCEKAAECGHRSFLMMAGCMDGRAVASRRLSYQGTFGVGYGICVFHVGEEDSSRCFLRIHEKRREKELRRRQMKEDAYVSLARRALEHYVTSGDMLPLEQEEAGLPEQMRQGRAGVFVSIHRDGSLRGCIGTIGPVYANLAEEIIQNAVSAGMRDPRFPPVRKEELPYLDYSVDVLGEAEAISGMEDLDARRYGVIVTKGRRQGLLLPNLDGVESVEEQVEIARQKAGIPEEDADVRLERFEVVRHGGNNE